MSFETGDCSTAADAAESCGVQAFLTFDSSNAEVQQRGGYDGWVMLVREDVDTQDLAWPYEHARLDGIASRVLRRLEASGVRVGDLGMGVTFSLLLEPPDRDEEDERLWCIEYFTEDYDLVVRSPAARALQTYSIHQHRPLSPTSPLHSPDPPRFHQADEAELAERLLAAQQLVLPHRAGEPARAASAVDDVEVRQLSRIQQPPEVVVAPAPAPVKRAVTPLALRGPHDFDDIQASLDEYAAPRSVGAA